MCLLVAGCGSPPGSSTGGKAASHASAPPASGTVSRSGPRNGLQAASLDLDVGAHQISVRTADIGNDLYRVTTDKPQQLEVSQSQSTVTVRSKSSGDQNGPNEVEVELNRDVRWKLHLNGGSSSEDVDVSGGDVQSLTLAAGVNRLDVILGAPHGEVPVDVTGSANHLALHLPNGTNASLQVVGAVSRLTVDRSDRGSVAGTARFTVGSGSAADRYQVNCEAALNTLSIERA